MNEHLLANYECQTMVTDGKINSTHVVSAEANEWGADLFVSIHNNAAGGDGYEALVYSEKRKALGQIFEKHVLAAGQNSRGVKLRPELNVLRLTDMPAVLNEGAFVDNKKDIEDWNDDHELKKLGIAYAEAAAEYLKLEKKVAAPAPAAKPTAPAPAPAKPMYRVFGADGKQTGAFQVESYAFNEVKKQLLVGGSARITLSEK
jgi:N-acetylmuramoyl-L-alanine amidase